MRCLLFLMICNTLTIGIVSRPRLQIFARNLILFANISSQYSIIENLEKYNWTLPAIATFDKWLNKNWIEPEFWERNYGSPTNKKEVRDEMKKYLYSFKAKKNQIDYLCKTAISEGIFNKEDSENIRKVYWDLHAWYDIERAQSKFFDPMYSGYLDENLDPASLLKLKVISDKYLNENKKQKLLLTYHNPDGLRNHWK
ncbi:uncharacterized protein CELE_T08G3.11 [Caenorhabditis elegans]|uniref:Uncharacterized protein n=1 Tax=Caenorhabditis elegans TaxID=6239 RepID=Q9XU54_CAEEL|nr:Uncharacterized protein CELE_T08G3.11 [Caenorhabditis elegans]CAB05790.2 Uncharacterized protein CELE_T08G3.11 [Caenorhabditis elegans]|eukprot:NP_507168.2 Uncharacterized protein CELE_T08G3.11 [Caenorhabditis elegans]